MINDVKNGAESRMKKSIEALKTELSKLRTGRAHPSLMEHVTVEYYGSMVPLSQVAQIAVEDRVLDIGAGLELVGRTIEGRLVEVNGPAEADLVGRGLLGFQQGLLGIPEVRVDEREAGLDPSPIQGEHARGEETSSLAGLDEAIPQGLGGRRGHPQLVSQVPGVSGSRDHRRDPA